MPSEPPGKPLLAVNPSLKKYIEVCSGKVKPESERKENKEFKNTCTRFRKINDRKFWMHDIGCLGLVHWDDPEGWYGEGGGGGFKIVITCTPVLDSC